MKYQLCSIFVTTVLFALMFAGYRYYRELPPNSSGEKTSQWPIDDNTYPKYFRIALAQYNEFTLGYFVRYTTAESTRIIDSRVSWHEGMLFLDGQRIMPRKGTFLALVREDNGPPRLLALKPQDVVRFLDMRSGTDTIENWPKLWNSLSNSLDNSINEEQGVAPKTRK